MIIQVITDDDKVIDEVFSCVDVSVHVVTGGECVRDRMVNDLINVTKRLYLSITNDVNVYACATTRAYTSWRMESKCETRW